MSPEYISNGLKDCADEQEIIIEYIESVNPQKNGFVKSFNKTVRYDWLNQELFDNLD